MAASLKKPSELALKNGRFFKQKGHQRTTSQAEIHTWTPFNVIPAARHVHRQMEYVWPHPLSMRPLSRWRHRQTGGDAARRKKPFALRFTSSCTFANVSGSSLLPHSFTLHTCRDGRGLDALDGDFKHVILCAFVLFVWAGGLRNKGLNATRLWSLFLSLRACKGKSLCCGGWDEKSSCNTRCCNSWTTCRSYTESSWAGRPIRARFLKPRQLNPCWIENFV